MYFAFTFLFSLVYDTWKDKTVTQINTKQAGSTLEATNASTVQLVTTCKRTGEAVQLTLFLIKGQGKVIPLQVRCGPEGG